MPARLSGLHAGVLLSLPDDTLRITALNAALSALRMAGVTALGFYTLAFNISSWPMTALSQVVRSISLPYFSRTDDAGRAVSKLMAIGWALALPTCGLLAALSAPSISVLFGVRCLPVAPVLAAL
ncbi:oligosaccharide flippase family protein, partial [Clavibacter michiganensis]|uniref:oligosaccharide flippase family protein n=1 Tax=Clavibacter michiganensis TaxID=28447 RepID=UPI00292F495A